MRYRQSVTTTTTTINTNNILNTLNIMLVFPLTLILLTCLPPHSQCQEFPELEAIFTREKDRLLSPEKRNTFQEALQESGGSNSHSERAKRDMPTMYMGKKKKLRTCANMNGILGGSNAFNYISFVLAILTLIVQTNNNINNNNNNLNQGMESIEKYYWDNSSLLFILLLLLLLSPSLFLIFFVDPLL